MDYIISFAGKEKDDRNQKTIQAENVAENVKKPAASAPKDEQEFISLKKIIFLL